MQKLGKTRKTGAAFPQVLTGMKNEMSTNNKAGKYC